MGRSGCTLTPWKGSPNGAQPNRKLLPPFGKGKGFLPNSAEPGSGAILLFAANGSGAGTRASRWKPMRLKKMAGW